ncbi:MAG TPA: AlpA family phage regulatory protein [Idiomarina loihiensis]|uniref:helix-turn-helix transcriptional regulator n=1 Tax=Gilvimarinus agarilyticus TaxID=679259 RepID=UPI00059F6298|nr:AlpA family phage regulatory protein [Idiomarina loihiensis]
MSNATNAFPSISFYRLPQVLEIIPVGKSTWWAGVKSGRFPKPVKLGPRTTAWKATDIAALAQSFSYHNEN